MIVNAHTWGSPVYVLDPRLQDMNKIPKWKPRSRKGQYMGVSPLHASTVAVVRNLQTGNLSRQFHVVYDDYFETVHAAADKAPKCWPELIRFQRFRSYYDDKDVPELETEWLDNEEKAKSEEREKQK